MKAIAGAISFDVRLSDAEMEAIRRLLGKKVKVLPAARLLVKIQTAVRGKEK